MLALSFGKAEHCLAVGAFSVSVVFTVADAVLCENEKVLYGVPDLEKSIVFFSSGINVFGKDSEYHPEKVQSLQSIQTYADRSESDKQKSRPDNKIENKQSKIKLIDAVSSVKEAGKLFAKSHSASEIYENI